MNVNYFVLVTIASLVSAASLCAVPRYIDQDLTATMREVRDTMSLLRHEVQNHDAEIKMFDERVNNQDSTLSSLRQQIQDGNQANKESIKTGLNSLEHKIASLEATNKGLVEDIQQFKKHANESSTVLTQYKQRIAELEKTIALQSQTLTHMQEALGSLMEALDLKEGTKSKASAINSSDGKKRYRIKSGDSLGEIARANHTTIKALKELNHLNTDEIVAGKTLELP